MHKGSSFQAILNNLYGLKRFGIRLGLENISSLLSELGEPQKYINAIHVGGTNGKGSTAAFIYNILNAKGYKVGLFTSPHLFSILERIQINNTPIPKEEFIGLFKKVKDVIPKDLEVTFFEFLTAMALRYFFDQKVDWAVIEVGMGGRFDATNLIHPKVSIITNIEYEHTDYLGKDLRKIATEKGGIIKKEGILVTAIREPEILSIMKKICHSLNAQMFAIDRDFEVRTDSFEITRTRFRFKDEDNLFESIEIPLAGEYQVDNAACAIKTSVILNDLDWEIGEENIKRGLRDVRWRGRFDVSKRNPIVICDGAHNPSGIKSFMESFVRLFAYDRLFVIFGVMSDKDFSKMGKCIIPHADSLILVKPNVERALDPEIMLGEFKRYKKEVLVIKNVGAAIDHTLSRASEKDIICIIGSLYLVSEALQILESVSVNSG